MAELSCKTHGEPDCHNAVLSDAKFRIITSLLWQTHQAVEPPLHISASVQVVALLSYHRDRLIAAAKALCWNSVVTLLSGQCGLDRLHVAIVNHVRSRYEAFEGEPTTWKIRVLANKTGSLDIDSAVLQNDSRSRPRQWIFIPESLTPAILEEPLCEVFVDTTVTTPSFFTTHKTTFRKPYDDARGRSGVSMLGPTQAEVLLYNDHQEIMEASLCTPYFFRAGRWITPPLSSGGNAGVTRRLALDLGLCIEAKVSCLEICNGEVVWLSNAVRGFLQGRVRIEGPTKPGQREQCENCPEDGVWQACQLQRCTSLKNSASSA